MTRLGSLFMETVYLYVALASFLLVMGTWTQYLLTVPQGVVPEWPTGSLIIQAVGFFAGLFALFTLDFSRLVSAIIAAVLAIFSIAMAIFFYWLLFTQRKTPIGDIRVQVGDKILPFQALTADGKTFTSDELSGNRVLFKFFRGGW